MRPRGTPPTPVAASKLSEVVEIAGTSDTSRSPSRIIDPLPNFFTILANAASTALPRSALVRSSAMAYILFLPLLSQNPVFERAEYNTSVSHLKQPFFAGG